MKSVIVGTAGHIDHGKTALVKALTGIDADRLEEEKRRGITIDIGFAHLELAAANGEKLRFGFVDVPGHERFVRNMLAGIGGIDLVLLVIAADESIKPQTREHFDICRLLNIRRGITVLTKIDMVDADTLEVVRLEVEDALRGSFLEDAPIVPVSSITGAGIPDLKQALVELSAQVTPKNAAAAFRLPIDRVFTMKGFGTVVTGTLISGTVKKEDELEVLPGGKRVRVRGIQVHGAAADKAQAGQRTAMNMAGVTTEEIGRGLTLVPAGQFKAGNWMDVQLTLLPTAKPLKHRARVHLHAFTAETLASVRFYNKLERLEAGQSAFARIVLEKPVLLFPHDRFIIRQFSPVVTIGGGVVLDALPIRVAATSEYTPAKLAPVLLNGSNEDVLRARIARRSVEGLTTAQAIAETGWAKETLEQTLAPMVRNASALRFGDVLVDARTFNARKEEIPAFVREYLDANPLSPGVGKELVRGRRHPAIFEAMLADLVKGKKLTITGDLLNLPGRGIVMKDDEAESKRQIEEAFRTAGIKVPLLNDVLAGLKLDRARAQKIVTLLLRDRVLVKVSDDLVFHRDTLEQLRATVKAMKEKTPQIEIGSFKDILGVTRKYAIPLLEWLDRERVTRRVGDARVIL